MLSILSIRTLLPPRIETLSMISILAWWWKRKGSLVFHGDPATVSGGACRQLANYAIKLSYIGLVGIVTSDTRFRVAQSDQWRIIRGYIIVDDDSKSRNSYISHLNNFLP